MKQTVRAAFLDTIPIMTGYLVLGFGFGIMLKAAGFGISHAFAMSLLIYAGSMQYIAVGLLAGGASLLTAAITTLMVNARHLFYGISMLDKYSTTGKWKPYLIISLTDETYSLVCHDNPQIPQTQKKNYYLFVSLLDHIYWVTGSVAGALFGTLVQFNTEGVDFVLTSLFLTIFLDQWHADRDHTPALIGLGVSVLFLITLGSSSFLIPTMLVIALILSLKQEAHDHE